MNVTIRQIEVFLAVAELGSFTRAAERLRMTQPALSQQVRELEAALDIRLFDRTTRRVELTAGGREFSAAAGKVLEDLELAVRNAADLAERRRGRIVIAAPPLLAAAILPRAIAEFRASHPGIQVAVLDTGTDRIVEAVRLGKADCGLGTFAPAEEGIERASLARDSLMLFCGPGSPFFDRDAVAWRELADEPLVTLTRDSGIRLLVEVGYEAAEVPLRPAFEVSQITTAVALVEAGLGSAVLPTYAFAAAEGKRVAARPLTAPSISRDIVLIHASGRSLSPAVAAFEPVLRRCAQRLTPRRSFNV